MAKIIAHTYGKLITAEDITTGKTYTDWRSEYYNWPGLIVIGESEHNAPGKHFIYVYLNSPDSMEQPYFHTSSGDMTIGDGIITIVTDNSKYVFEEGDFDITEDQKKELYINACIYL